VIFSSFKLSITCNFNSVSIITSITAICFPIKPKFSSIYLRNIWNTMIISHTMIFLTKSPRSTERRFRVAWFKYTGNYSTSCPPIGFGSFMTINICSFFTLTSLQESCKSILLFEFSCSESVNFNNMLIKIEVYSCWNIKCYNSCITKYRHSREIISTIISINESGVIEINTIISILFSSISRRNSNKCTIRNIEFLKVDLD